MYEYIFQLLNTQLNLLLTLFTQSWDFEMSYNINFPSAVDTESDLKPTGFISLYVGDLIDLLK